MTNPDPTAGTALGEPFVGLAQRDHLRAILRSNMMDGDEGGTYTAACRALLTEIVELVADDWAPALLAAAREAGREEGRAEEQRRIVRALTDAGHYTESVELARGDL